MSLENTINYQQGIITMQKLNISDLQKVATVLDANDVSLYDFKVNVSYDTDLAGLYFNNFKDGHMNNNVNLFFGKRVNDYLVIFENEKVLNESHYKKSKLARMNKIDLTNLADEMLGYGFDDSNKQALINGLMSITNKEYYTQHYENECYNNLDFDFTISGYSQGDCIKVKIVGNVEKWINEEYLTHIFYDTPISGNIEVFKNGSLIDDFQLYDLANFNEYDSYDKDKLIAMIVDYCYNKDYKDLLIAYLDKNLNTDIGYNY